MVQVWFKSIYNILFAKTTSCCKVHVCDHPTDCHARQLTNWHSYICLDRMLILKCKLHWHSLMSIEMGLQGVGKVFCVPYPSKFFLAENKDFN